MSLVSLPWVLMIGRDGQRLASGVPGDQAMRLMLV